VGDGPRGRFFVLDGIDGCGKSTQAARLAAHLARASGRAPLHLREPGSTLVGERIRALLLEPEPALAPATQVLLFAAARSEMLRSVVAPALAEGCDVVCERFHPSTYAYQGIALGVGGEAVLALLRAWAGDPHPDRIVILDLDPEEAEARRARSRGAGADRFEGRGRGFHRRVAAGYRAFAAGQPGVALVDGRGTPEEVEARVRAEVFGAGR
jgi:dTMP kinase